MRPSCTREAGKEAPPHHPKGSGLWRVLLQVQGDTAWGAGAHPAWEEGVSLLNSWASKIVQPAGGSASLPGLRAVLPQLENGDL